jgi:predicted regulator of Ras-like GTPase activity (Roadblock/LC7/MglB family)
LELALSVVAPLFLAHQKRVGKLPQVTVDESIPDLFFGLPKPEAAPTAKSAETKSYNWSENSDTPRMEETDYKRPNPGETNGVAKHATPNEIVSRAAALDGVAGALIALPEGLLVAGRVPPDFNADTLAAFLPQIFSKVGQSTKELRLGELNNLSFTVGNVPWKIVRVNALYFAAFGCVSGTMPSNELARLATELDRRH